MSVIIQLSKMFLAILLLCSIPPNFCQLALASSPYLGLPSARRASALTDGSSIRGTRSRTLFTKYSEARPNIRKNSSAMESEIAAIFKGVAYGPSSTVTPATTRAVPSTTTTVFTTTTRRTTPFYFRGISEKKLFIGKQREVYPNTPILTSEPSAVFQDLPQSSPEIYRDNLKNKSAYTYLLQAEKALNNKRKVIEEEDEYVGPRYPNYDEESYEHERKDIQVRVTNILKKQGFEAIQQKIGRAWTFHVYFTGISFGIVAAVCLLSLSRISLCSSLLPRGYYMTLHSMIFLASFLRCLLFLHDPYGAYNRLPSVLTSLLFNTVDPCLTTAYAVVLMVLLRAARYRLVPLNMQSPLVLATICGIHIGGSVVVDVSSGVLEDERVISILNITTQVATVTWGTVLCLGYVVSLSNIKKAAQRQQGDLVRLTFNRTNIEGGSLQKSSTRPSLTYAATTFLICTLLQGFLIAFVIINLVTSKNPSEPNGSSTSEAWAWWTQVSLERLIEIVLCVLMLVTGLVLTQSKPRNNKQDKDDKIFSIFGNCGKGTKTMKNIDVYPVASEKCNILGKGTLNQSSLNGTMNYSTNGWKQFQTSPDNSLKYPVTLNTIDGDLKKNSPDAPQPHFPSLQIIHGSTLIRSPMNHEKGVMIGSCLKEHNQATSPVPTHYYPHLNNSNTLPGNNYYCHEAHIQSHINAAIAASKSNTIRASQNHNMRRQAHLSPCHTVGNSAYVLPPSDCKSNQYEHEYEVAPYYTTSNISSVSHTYVKPYTYCTGNNSPGVQEATTHNIQNLRTPSRHCHHHEADPKSEMSIGSSQSEIHVDYLTDGSSVDGLNGTLSRSLTLPLSQHNQIARTKTGTIDSTPDSAVEMDYSPPSSDLKSPESVQKTNIVLNNGQFEFVRLGNASFDQLSKGQQSGFLGKIVNGSATAVVGYTPLSLDDTCTSSYSSDYASSSSQVMKRSTSSEKISSPNQQNRSNIPNSSSIQDQNLTPTRHFQPNPITCL